MDFQNQVENEKFLKVCGSPYKSMCCSLITLRSGVIIIGIIDIIIGILYFIDLIQFVTILITHGVFYIFSFLSLGIACVKIISIPFALIGIRGINRITPADISLYSKFKIVEMFVLMLLTLSKGIELYRY